ncbi:precorrin-4 C(11)-methyltransferase [Saccharopolyspora cebuensis]|uniref:Precorrin-4 C(11)-methyltransferase n=1 Tax=Saccharopolyspora cebuensis TaxID=418759 RepID=A0ABV4CIS0_9PSEU
MVSGRISFIGAGPGAADLITVRGARRIAEADIVVWAASLVAPECIQEHARPDAELVDSSRLTHEQAVEIYRRAERERLNVARVHSGDPSLWGAVQEQYDACARMALEVEIVPGVAAFSAAAASVGRELTVPEVAQSLVLTRLEGGKTPMPEGEKVREFAKHGTTMALFLSAARTGQLVEELRAGGYDDDTPVLVAYKVTWPDELMLRTTLGELEQTVKQHKLWRHTLFIVGKALTSGGTRSHLYHAGHFHTYRRADPAARRALRAERPSRRAKPAEPEPAEPEPGAVRDSDVAWWAVRDWQATARGAAKVAAHRSAARVDSAQPELFAEQDADAAPEQRPAPEREQVPERTAEPAAAQPEQAEPEQPAAEAEPKQAEPKQPEPEQSAAEQAAPKRTSPASTGTAKASTAKSAPKRRTTKAGEPKAAKSRSTAKGKRTSDER